jgi:hypothetical protein
MCRRFRLAKTWCGEYAARSHRFRTMTSAPHGKSFTPPGERTEFVERSSAADRGLGMPVFFAPPTAFADRRARRRHRRKLSLRRLLRRLLSHLTLGFLLAGCATPRVSVGHFSSLQAQTLHPSPMTRVEAYRRCRQDCCAKDLHLEAMELLARAVRTDGHPVSRSAAAAALATYRDALAKDALVKAAEDSSSLVRYEAARGLAVFVDAGTIPLLGRLAAADEDVDVRRAAVVALKKAGDAESRRLAMLKLATCLKDRDFTVSRLAAEALQERTGQDFGRDYDRWARYLGVPNAGTADPSAPPPPARTPFVPVAN